MKPDKEYTGRSNIRMYNCDCMELMRSGKTWDLAIVDPPYGIETRGNAQDRFRNGKQLKTVNDDKPDEQYFIELFRVSKNQIIWGYNHLSNMLPKCREFVFWYKEQPVVTFSDGELAWTSYQKTARCFHYPFHKANLENKGYKIHPTQKPVKLYKWLLANYAPNCKYCNGNGSYYEDVAGDGGSRMMMHCDECNGTGNGTILDTHGGSMSIAIACWDMGFDLDICELDSDYFNDAVKRFENHIKQTTLF